MKFFFNIMKTWTGRDLTTVPDSPIHAADVFVANGAGDPIPVSATFSPEYLDVVQTLFMAMASNAINATSGDWVQFGSDIAADVKKLQLSYTAGQPLEFGLGADKDNVTRKFILNQGGEINLDILMSVGNKVWVKSLSSSGVSSGFLTANLIG